jgi:transposase InsO family protein
MSCDTSRGTATIAQLCEALGITRQAYYAAKTRTIESEKTTAGVDSDPTQESSQVEIVEPGRSCDAGSGSEVPDPAPTSSRWLSAVALIAAIREVVRKFPAWGVRKVWASLRRAGQRASRKRVWKTMQALGLTLPPICERAVPLRPGHVAVPESNRRWATDLTTTWTARDGWVSLVPVIDCGDRFVFEIEVTKSQQAWDVLVPVERALLVCFQDPQGVPEGLELRSDHGPQYTGSDCEALCRTWKVEHTFSPVGRPTGNAVAERFIQTLKVELLWTRDWESLDEVRQAVREWLPSYNHERPHQALDWKTPNEKRQENLGRERLAA